MISNLLKDDYQRWYFSIFSCISNGDVNFSVTWRRITWQIHRFHSTFHRWKTTLYFCQYNSFFLYDKGGESENSLQIWKWSVNFCPIQSYMYVIKYGLIVSITYVKEKLEKYSVKFFLYFWKNSAQIETKGLIKGIIKNTLDGFFRRREKFHPWFHLASNQLLNCEFRKRMEILNFDYRIQGIHCPLNLISLNFFSTITEAQTISPIVKYCQIQLQQ